MFKVLDRNTVAPNCQRFIDFFKSGVSSFGDLSSTQIKEMIYADMVHLTTKKFIVLIDDADLERRYNEESQDRKGNGSIMIDNYKLVIYRMSINRWDYTAFFYETDDEKEIMHLRLMFE